MIMDEVKAKTEDKLSKTIISRNFDYLILQKRNYFILDFELN